MIEHNSVLTEVLIPLSGILGGLAGALAFVAFFAKLMFLPLVSWASQGLSENQEKYLGIKTELTGIRKGYHGEEQAERILALYKRNGYNPFLPLKSVLPLILQIPIFVSVFSAVMSGTFIGENLWLIGDLTAADSLGNLNGQPINLLPISMLTISILSLVHINHIRPMEKSQFILGITFSLGFFSILYQSPAALVIYWSLNIVFQWIIDLAIAKKTAPRSGS